MKKTILFLLMAVFFLAGCREDKLQDVAFSDEMITVGAEAQKLTIEIQANCPWYIKTNSDSAYATSTYGEGNSLIEIVVLKNATYEPTEHLFTLTSEDGNDKAELLITQEARIKMEIVTNGNIPAEGGYYNIYMNTNDNIKCSEYPEWITYVASRAVKEKTFVLECMANRTGKPRYATLVFTGRNEEYAVDVKQDSYTPTGATVRVPNDLIDGLITYKFQIDVIPVYADWSKLDISLSNGAKHWIEEDRLYMEFPDYGVYTLTIFANEKMIHQQDINVHPIDPTLLVENGEKICLGDFLNLTDKNSTLSFSNNNLVQKQNDGSYRFIREGELTITATNNYSGKKKSVKVKISRVILSVETERVTASGDKNRVSLVYSARGCDMKDYEFYLTDKKYPAHKIEPVEGTVTGAGVQTVYYSPSSELVEATLSDPVMEVLNKYTLHFITYINGEKHHVLSDF